MPPTIFPYRERHVCSSPLRHRLAGGCCFLLIAVCGGFLQSPIIADEPEAPRRPVLTGQVVDQEGEPVAGAKVECGAFASWNTGQSIVTDDQGRFEAEVGFVPMLSRSKVTATAEQDRLYGEVRLPEGPLPQGQEVDQYFGKIVITIRPPGRPQVRVIDAEGLPIADAVVGGTSAGRPLQSQVTDEKGEATLTVPGDLPVQHISAYKPGAGFDYRAFTHPTGNPSIPIPPDGVQLTLGQTHPLEVTVQDISGRPVAGARVQLSELSKPGEIVSVIPSYVIAAERQVTDAQGKLQVDWLPAWHLGNVTVTASSDRHSQTKGEYAPQGTRGVWSRSPTTTASGGKIVLEMVNTTLIRGHVRDAAGNPVSEIEVSADSGGGIVPHSRGSAKTDDQGKYEIRVACQRVYLVTVTDSEVVSDAQVVFEVRPGQDVENIDLTLQAAGTRVHGQVRDAEGMPAAEQLVSCWQFYLDTAKIAELNLPDPGNTRAIHRPVVRRSTWTDAEGRYSLLLGAGFHSLEGQYSFARGSNAALEFEITDEPERQINLVSDRRLSTSSNVRGTIFSGDPPRPLAKAQLLFIPQARGAGARQAVSNEDGRYNTTLSPLPTWFRALTEDGTLGAIGHREADNSEVDLEIYPTITATGQLQNAETGEPLAGRNVQYAVEIPLGRDPDPPIHTAWFRSAATDDEGRFTLPDLLSGGTYTLRLRDAEGNLSDPIERLLVRHGSQIDIVVAITE